MYLQKVISKKRSKKIFFVGILKVTDVNRIRIRTKMSRIRNTVHNFLALTGTVADPHQDPDPSFHCDADPKSGLSL
jgi:hypothetical protein